MIYEIINKTSAFLFLILIITCTNIFSKGIDDEIDYNVNKIPSELKEDASAVVRIHSVYFEVFDRTQAVMKVKKAVTIFEKNEQEYGELVLWYDKFRKIESIDGKIYDSEGKEVRELDDDEIMDFSSYKEYTLYEDNRIKTAELYYDRYPYTVEFNYEISYDDYISWPSWYSRSSTDPVEYSSFDVKIPSDYELRSWCNLDTVKPVIKNEGRTKLYSWETHNLPGLPANATDEDIEDYASIVMIAPSKFKVEDYPGTMNSWKEFGSWYYDLIKEEGTLPATVQNDIFSILNGITDIKEKIFALYHYMQGRTRYVSVQLGIGGWKPFSAEYVHLRGYGDCKALSNYMVALLKSAGITAYPVLINSGHDRLTLISEFPSNQFNHVIVCVPDKNDTLWLECTSQITPPGFLSWHTENREALMITPEGGIIVRTPSSNSVVNMQRKSINVVLSAYNTEVNGKIYWYGDQQDYARSVEKDLTPEDKAKWIVDLLEVPDIKLNNFSFDTSDKLNNEIELKLNMTLPKYASVSGTRMFFNPNLIERRTSVPKDYPDRHSPVRFQYPYLDIDSVKYAIPEGYKVESISGEVTIESSFGKFNSKTVSLGESTLLYTRSLEIKDYSVPAAKYSEYRKFFADIVKADRGQVVLVKK